MNLSGVWRYRELVLPSAGANPVTHPEGDTPLLRRVAIAEWAGLMSLWLKHEGHNPTGSFKDRGMTVGVTQAKRIGATAVACASTGNTSASLAAYGAQAGSPVLVFVPAGQVALGQAVADRWPTAPGRCSSGATSTPAFGWCSKPRRNSASTCSTPSIPSGSRGRRPSCFELLRSAGMAAAGLDRAPGGQSRKHVGLRQSAARGEGRGASLTACPTRRGAGSRCSAIRRRLRGGVQGSSDGEGARRWRRPSRSATLRRGIGR